MISCQLSFVKLQQLDTLALTWHPQLPLLLLVFLLQQVQRQERLKSTVRGGHWRWVSTQTWLHGIDLLKSEAHRPARTELHGARINPNQAQHTCVSRRVFLFPLESDNVVASLQAGNQKPW
jgi:hypothetical protein